MKLLFSLWLFALCALSANAQKTEIKYLSGTDKDHTVTWDFYCTNGMNSGKWTTIQVPSCWELQGFGSYIYGNIDLKANEKGLYKYEFTVPKAWEKKSVYIVFEGSMTDTEVKINGKLAGPIHQGAFYRFKYNISPLLVFNGKNLLEVTVSKESTNESVNRAERISDFWVFGGIFRPVYLEAQPEAFIERVAIDAKADGSFSLDVFVQGSLNAGIVEAQIQTMDGKPFGKPLTANFPDKAEKINLNGSFAGPALWNPELPNRYQVVVRLKTGKNLIHTMVQKFGFRTVEVKTADGIYVNGTKIMFRGVCRHTFWPTSGRTSSKQLAIDDVNLMKDMNMNAVRMSHYPPDQYFLDVCDSMGMFVLDELAGWQKFYDTPTAKRLVKQMVERDVNHPSIVLWDNGNEGGFNKDVRLDYALYDPQKRTVIEPWSKINGTDTKHYPGYAYVENALNNGNLIYFPTEFLHGLYDGGHGAGLDDYWNLMTSKPLSAGGFLWVFADEGVVRKDLKDSIDNHGNNAPDGILGPYHEKEGSFYTIKEIWSPAHIPMEKLTGTFDGTIPVMNRFLFTNLNKCSFSCELVKFSGSFPKMTLRKQKAAVVSPNLAPGNSGALKVSLPSSWKEFDALYITATDPFGRLIYTWSWNITLPQSVAARIVKTTQDKVSVSESGDLVVLSSGSVSAQFSKKTGLLTGVRSGTQVVPFNNGPVFLGDSAEFKQLRHYASGSNYVVENSYDKSPGSFVRWTMLPGGWLELEYQYHPLGENDFTGITFDFPEGLVTGASLLANGPYHVWKNRLKGAEFGLFTKKYNNTITGQTWDYPEFKGYYSNFYAVEVQTRQLPFTVVSASDDLFLHLFTPGAPRFIKGDVNPPFPSGNISILNGISAIGTKFSQAEAEGPQGQKNQQSDKPFAGKVYFWFGG